MIYLMIVTIIVCACVCGAMYTHLRESYQARIDYLEDEVFMYKMVVLNYETVLEKMKGSVER